MLMTTVLHMFHNAGIIVQASGPLQLVPLPPVAIMGKAKCKASPAGKGNALKAGRKFWDAANQETIEMIMDELAQDPTKALPTWRLLNSGMVAHHASSGRETSVDTFPDKVKKVKSLPKPWVKKLLGELVGDSFCVTKVCKAGKNATMELIAFGCGVDAEWPLPQGMDKNLFKQYMVQRHVAMQSPLATLKVNTDSSLDWEKFGCFSMAHPAGDEGNITKVRHMLGSEAHPVKHLPSAYAFD